MGTGSFPGVKCGRGVLLLTTHPLLVPRSWKSRAIPLPTLWATPGLQREHFTVFLLPIKLKGQKWKLKTYSVRKYDQGLNRSTFISTSCHQCVQQRICGIRAELQFRPNPARKLSANLYDIYHWCVQWKTADDGQRNCPKHVQFYSKNKFEKLVHLVGFIIRIYHDARSPEHQTLITVCTIHTSYYTLYPSI